MGRSEDYEWKADRLAHGRSMFPIRWLSIDVHVSVCSHQYNAGKPFKFFFFSFGVLANIDTYRREKSPGGAYSLQIPRADNNETGGIQCKREGKKEGIKKKVRKRKTFT